MFDYNRQPHFIISKIDSLIPRYLQWENPTLVSSVVPAPRGIARISPARPAYDEVRIYSLQGKLIAAVHTRNAVAILSSTQFARGAFIVRYLSRNVPIQTEKMVWLKR